MARYKDYSYEQTRLIPIAFSHQILLGTFEHTLNYLIDNEFDLSVFEQRYHNDEMGAPAYDPAILLKISLYAYSRGITSSRQIEQCCEQNIIFMALSADTHPHFATNSGVYLIEQRADHRAVSGRAFDLQQAGINRQRDVCSRRM